MIIFALTVVSEILLAVCIVGIFLAIGLFLYFLGYGGSDDMRLKVKALHTAAKLPVRGSERCAGYDLFSVERVTILPGHRARIKTGVAIALPRCMRPGFVTVGLIQDRSSMGNKGVTKFAGVIDEDYRGEWMVILFNSSQDVAMEIEPGDKICQFIVAEVLATDTLLVPDLDDTPRGVRGFGSTGK